MRTFLPALVFGALSASVALAQTTVTGQPSTSGTNSTQSQGQEAVTRPNTDQMQNARPTSPAATTGSVGNAALEPGANSFTEGQVRSRLEQAGFMDVTELRKDDQGIWRGKAMQSGRSVTVGFDFKGNVAAQ